MKHLLICLLMTLCCICQAQPASAGNHDKRKQVATQASTVSTLPDHSSHASTQPSTHVAIKPTHKTTPTVASHPTPKPSQSAQAFAHHAATQTSLSSVVVLQTLKHAHYLPDVIAKMNRPYESKPFDTYQTHFIDHQRIQAGVDFWRAHTQRLKEAEQRYGVDPSIIIAILGVETFYGQQEGTYSVLNALYTLAFYYPSRQTFFSHELIEFLAMCHRQHISPYSVLGSYAGAFGMPQFMPSSYRAYGVDYHKNHHIDLMHDTDDVIMSVANYLAKAGWQHHIPVAIQIHPSKSPIPAQWKSDSGEPLTSVATLRKAGYALPKRLHDEGVSVLSLPTSDKPEYWAAFSNLKTILHYNGSVNYAVTVGQLANAIKQAHDKAIQTHRS